IDGGDEPMCTPNLRPPLNGTNKHTRHIGIGMPVLLGAIEYSTKHSARWITPAPDSSQPQGCRHAPMRRFSYSPVNCWRQRQRKNGKAEHTASPVNHPTKELAVYQHLKGYTMEIGSASYGALFGSPKTFHDLATTLYLLSVPLAQTRFHGVEFNFPFPLDQVKAAVSSSDLKHLSRFSSSSDPPEQLQLLQLELRQLL
ncbi:hypothetical protein KY284_015078, partial [Solanum tuberosum]